MTSAAQALCHAKASRCNEVKQETTDPKDIPVDIEVEQDENKDPNVTPRLRPEPDSQSEAKRTRVLQKHKSV